MLLCIARNQEARLRDIALEVGITERATQRIVSELVDAGYLSRKRVGRRNQYKVHTDRPMRAPEVEQTDIGDVLNVLMGKAASRHASSAAALFSLVPLA